VSDRPAARLVRLGGLTLIGAFASGGIAFLLIPLAARAFVRGIELLAVGCIWLATSISMGKSVWSMVATMWGTAASMLVTPVASAMLWGLVATGALALYWLQRLMGSGEE